MASRHVIRSIPLYHSTPLCHVPCLRRTRYSARVPLFSCQNVRERIYVIRISARFIKSKMVGKRGFEPPHLSTAASKTAAATSYATRPFVCRALGIYARSSPIPFAACFCCLFFRPALRHTGHQCAVSLSSTPFSNPLSKQNSCLVRDSLKRFLTSLRGWHRRRHIARHKRIVFWVLGVYDFVDDLFIWCWKIDVHFRGSRAT